ncbi:MAG: Gfo/Idh/MocA family oxidoreductase, partial [Chloroflexota bacterium]
MTTTHFGMIGAGWRAEFFLRIAEALPGHFRVKRMLVRNPEKAQQISDRWQVQTVQTLDALLKPNDLDFVVVSVPWAVSPIMLRELTERRMPALAETPPAPDLDGLIALNELTKIGGKIQVAEQYQFQPAHAARLAIAQSGKLGIVSQAQVSVAHDYHGINLLRGLLNVNYEEVTIRAQAFESPIVAGPGRNGPPLYEQVKPARQTIAYLDYGDKLGVYDFTGEQYFSWIRSQRVLVRGERGEINNTTVRYLKDYQTPIQAELRRLNAGEDGNLEGYYFKGILLGDEWVVRNPFAPARLTDDEIAVATCLQKMAEYVHGGPDFCSLVGWRIGPGLRAGLAVGALTSAITSRRPDPGL